MQPWDIHPALTAERLAFIARLIRNVRAEVADSHEPDKGDTSWGFGSRAHERQMFAISNAGSGVASDWLRVLEPGLHFVFAIGDVPIRFYRGEHEHPPARTLRRNFTEIEAHQQTWFGVPGFRASSNPVGDPEYFWRLAINTDTDGKAAAIVLVQVAEDGATGAHYDIPEIAAVPAFSTEPKRSEGRELPPPKVELKSTKKTKTKKVNDNGEG